MSTPGSFRPPLDAAVAEVAFQVDRDTVLQARNALLAESERLRGEVERTAWQVGIGDCGSDPVSPEARVAFNNRIGLLLDGCARYCDELAEAASALDATARSYGYTDEEIATSFRNSQ